MSHSFTIITGASEGIGKAFALEYARKGRNLILISRTRSKLDQLKVQILEDFPEITVKTLSVDLGKPGAAQHIFKETHDLKISTLILNAGQVNGGLWSGTPIEKHQTLIQLNISHIVEMAWYFMPHLEAWAREHPRSETKEGGLLTVSSMTANVGLPWGAAYAASKAYILHLTEAIHDEMRERAPELRVCCLVPGVTDTGLWGAFSNFRVNKMSKSFAQSDKNGVNRSSVRMSMMPVDRVARDGVRGLEKGQAVVICGWFNILSTIATKISPRFIGRSISSKLMNSTHAAEMELSADEKKRLGL